MHDLALNWKVYSRSVIAFFSDILLKTESFAVSIPVVKQVIELDHLGIGKFSLLNVLRICSTHYFFFIFLSHVFEFSSFSSPLFKFSSHQDLKFIREAVHGHKENQQN